MPWLVFGRVFAVAGWRCLLRCSGRPRAGGARGGLGRAPPRSAGAAADAKEESVEAPPGPVLAVVSIAKQRIQVYGSTGLLAQSPVSTGMAGHRTPPGVFSILQRSRFHRSNIYSDAPMPYMQRLTWSGVALHAGVVPGYPASHGCIRLPHHVRVRAVGDDQARHPRGGGAGRRSAAPHRACAPAGAEADAGAGGRRRNGPPAGRRADVASPPVATVTDAAAEPATARLLDPLRARQGDEVFVAKDAAAKAKAATLAVETAAGQGRRGPPGNRGAASRRACAGRGAAPATRRAARGGRRPADRRRARQGGAGRSRRPSLPGRERAADEARLIEAVMSRGGRRGSGRGDRDRERAPRGRRRAQGRRAGRGADLDLRQQEGGAGLHPPGVDAQFRGARRPSRQPGRPFGTHVYLATGPSADGETMGLALRLDPAVAARAATAARQGGRAQAAPASGVASGDGGRACSPASSCPRRRGGSSRSGCGQAPRSIVSDNGISGETGTLHRLHRADALSAPLCVGVVFRLVPAFLRGLLRWLAAGRETGRSPVSASSARRRGSFMRKVLAGLVVALIVGVGGYFGVVYWAQ